MKKPLPGIAVRMAAKAGKAEIFIYDEIGGSWDGSGITMKDFAEQVKALGDVSEMTIRINTVGGSLYVGLGMYHILSAHPARKVAIVEGLSASAGTLPQLACDEIQIPENSYVMIHNPMTFAFGDSEEILRTAAVLEQQTKDVAKLYSDRTKLSVEEVRKLMDAETWMNGREAVAKGFGTVLVANKTVAACADLSHFKNVPEALKSKEPPMTTSATPTPAPAPVAPATPAPVASAAPAGTPAAAPAATPATPAPAPAAASPVDMAGVQDAVQKAIAAERKRGQEITAICKSAGFPEMAQKFIGDEKFSVQDVRNQMFDEMIKRNPPIGTESDGAEMNGGDPHLKFRKEYQADAANIAKMGVTEEQWVRTRCRDEGIDPPAKKPAA